MIHISNQTCTKNNTLVQQQIQNNFKALQTKRIIFVLYYLAAGLCPNVQ